MPVAGTIAGFCLGLLIGQLSGNLASSLAGTTPEHFSLEGAMRGEQCAGDASRQVFEQQEDAIAAVQDFEDQVDAARSSMTVACLQRLLDVFTAEIALLEPVNEEDRSLFHRMLREWTLENARTQFRPNDDVNGVAWFRAAQEHFDPDSDPEAMMWPSSAQPALFAYQTRAHLMEAGLPIDQAQRLIDRAEVCFRGGDDPHEAAKAALNQYDGWTLRFNSGGTDIDRFLQFLEQHGPVMNDFVRHQVRDGLFRLDVRLELSLQPDPYPNLRGGKWHSRPTSSPQVDAWFYDMTFVDRRQLPIPGRRPFRICARGLTIPLPGPDLCLQW